VLYSREGTLQRVVQKIAELGKLGVQFATFPETVVPYYPYFSFVQAPFEIRTGKQHLRLLDQAVNGTLSHHTSHRRGCEAGRDGGLDRRQRARNGRIRSDEMTRFIYALKEIRACLEAELLTDVQQRLALLSRDMENHNGQRIPHQPALSRN
jgi:hypothetical protein